MKQQDIAILLIIIAFAGGLSYFGASKIISPGSKLSAEVVQPITPEFTLPSDKIFNPSAINPTKLIEIAPNQNQEPFAEASQ